MRLLALVGAAACLACAFLLAITPRHTAIEQTERFDREPTDIPLLNEAQKAQARETGGDVEFEVGGIRYSAHALPEEYWRF